MLGRRDILKLGGAAALTSLASATDGAPAAGPPPIPDLICRTSATEAEKADYRIEIGTARVELGKEVAVSTRVYNGGFPGPLLRLREGKRVVVDVHNTTDTPEQLHWHGQFLPPEVDGASEEGTPFIPARGMRRIAFTPGPAGFRFYHTHTMTGGDLALGLYSGQAGPVYIEPRHEPGAYDREIFLTLKEFSPYFNQMEMKTGFLAPTNRVRELYDMDQAAIARMRSRGVESGWQVGYQFYSINGRMLGQGEPVRVKPGERVLFHVLNASATEIRSLALPHHSFRVVALDGNPVPRPADVPVLWLAPAERVSAIVEMSAAGVWIMGDLDEHARMHGMGIVVEYAGASNRPAWEPPGRFQWDYRRFAAGERVAQAPDKTVELVFATEYSARDGFDTFSINGRTFDMHAHEPLLRLAYGRRYRLKLRNATDDVHPIHLHRHSFELTDIAGMPTAGVVKDVAMIGGFEEMTIDFTADQRGPSLFHCHMQDHMDFGFMALFDCA
jgi:FtsP/CotA-like multicopper oxidase with cupredoxin domain